MREERVRKLEDRVPEPKRDTGVYWTDGALYRELGTGKPFASREDAERYYGEQGMNSICMDFTGRKGNNEK